MYMSAESAGVLKVVNNRLFTSTMIMVLAFSKFLATPLKKPKGRRPVLLFLLLIFGGK